MPLPQTPTRRSQRFQPTPTPTLKHNDKSVLECKWTSGSIHTRKTNSALDFLPEEQQLGEEEEGGNNEDEEKEGMTVFYDSFWMKRKVTMHRTNANTARRRVHAAGKVEGQTYRVGDTVMVETDTLYLVRRPPSIGVIIAMWHIRTEKEKGDTDRDMLDPSKMRIRVHWFLRPSEMASIRAKREHEENEIYYSLTTTAIVTPSVILARCSVTGTGMSQETTRKEGKSKSKPKWGYIPSTPSKIPKQPRLGPSSPLKKSTLFSPPSSSRDSDSDSNSDSENAKASRNNSTDTTITDPDRIFYCRLAVDSRRGLFYTFNWDEHRRNALLRTMKPPVTMTIHDESGPNYQEEEKEKGDGDNDTWGEDTTWDVVEDVNPKRSAKGRTKSKSKVAARDNDSDNEGEDDSDEYDGDERSDGDNSGLEPDDEEEEEDGEEGDELQEPRTPSKKRKRSTFATPRQTKSNIKTTKSRRTLAQPTPHSKAALARRRKGANASTTTTTPRKRKIPFALLHPQSHSQSLTFQSSNNMGHLPKDPWSRSMHALHVGSRPDALPCREEEYARVLQCVGELLEEGSGGCIYISGVPGTGKTATVHSVVRELKRMAENSEINPFTYVEINGLKIAEPTAAYNLLWEAVSGSGHDDGHLRLSWKESLKALMRNFTDGNRGPGGHACVVLMDELDQLVTPKQDVVYNFFNWPTLVGSKLVVIAVANTMDLPERVMTGRVRSRLGMTRINFQPYTREQLEKIVVARLGSVVDSLGEEEDGSEKAIIIAPDAIKLAAMTVSRITGDARRVLDICRRAVELVVGTKGTVKAPHIREVVQTLQNSPTAAYLRDLSFHERVMLASLIKCVRREGVDEVKLSEVQHQHLTYLNVLTSSDHDDDPTTTRRPTRWELDMVLDSLAASRAVLVEYKSYVPIGGGRRGRVRGDDGERRIVLNIEQAEVERVLGDVGGMHWRNVFAS